MLVALVKPRVSLVFSSSSSTTRGLSEVCQMNPGAGQKCTEGANIDSHQLHRIDVSHYFDSHLVFGLIKRSVESIGCQSVRSKLST
jgi:hypothetical protein